MRPSRLHSRFIVTHQGFNTPGSMSGLGVSPLKRSSPPERNTRARAQIVAQPAVAQLVVTSEFAAPRHLLFRTYISGPTTGLTLTIDHIDVRHGGTWCHIASDHVTRSPICSSPAAVAVVPAAPPIGATDISRRRTDKVVAFPLTLSLRSTSTGGGCQVHQKYTAALPCSPSLLSNRCAGRAPSGPGKTQPPVPSKRATAEAGSPAPLPAGFGTAASLRVLYVAVRAMGRPAARSHVHIVDSVVAARPIRSCLCR